MVERLKDTELTERRTKPLGLRLDSTVPDASVGPGASTHHPVQRMGKRAVPIPGPDTDTTVGLHSPDTTPDLDATRGSRPASRDLRTTPVLGREARR